MKGLITSYRGGRHTKRSNQFLVELAGVSDSVTASKFIGKPASLGIPGKNLAGKIVSAHGKRGLIVARFPSGMSGNVLGRTIEILE